MKQIREENNNTGKKADKMHVKEWLHQNAKRPIKVKFGPDETIYLLNRKGDKLRTVSIKNIESLVLEVTQVRYFKGQLSLNTDIFKEQKKRKVFHKNYSNFCLHFRG